MTAVLDAPMPAVQATSVQGPAAELLDRLSRRTSITNVHLDAITPEVGAVISTWDAAAGSENSTVLDMAFARQTIYPSDPVDAVKFLEDVLGETQESVLAAVGVAYRTFHGWQGQGRRPRTTSLAQLWPMVQAVALMKDARPGFTAWFRSTPEAQAAFRAGDLPAFVLIEATSAQRERGLADWFIAPDETVDEQSQRPRRSLGTSRVGTGRPPRRGVGALTDDR
ncbi:MAG: hypothetical protein AB7G36_16975 [Candidatus Nanopelagicales bacterium]